MSSQTLVEVYRTNEAKDTHTFDAVCTLTYFGDIVFISGMSGTFNISAWKELRAYLKSIEIKEAHYIRRGIVKIVK